MNYQTKTCKEVCIDTKIQNCNISKGMHKDYHTIKQPATCVKYGYNPVQNI